MPTAVYVPYVLVTSLCLLVSLGYLFFFDIKTESAACTEKKIPQQQKAKEQAEIKAERVRFFVCAAVGITIFAVNWLTKLSTGF